MYESLCVLSIFDVHKQPGLRCCWKWKFSLTRLSSCRLRRSLFDKHGHEKNNFSPPLSLLMPVLRGLGRMTESPLWYSLTSISPPSPGNFLSFFSFPWLLPSPRTWHLGFLPSQQYPAQVPEGIFTSPSLIQILLLLRSWNFKLLSNLVNHQSYKLQ